MTDTNLPALSLIVPALNEEEVVKRVIDEIYAVASKNLSLFEIILIDDGSIDTTPDIFENIAKLNPQYTFIKNPRNLGLGESFKIGVNKAKYEYVMLLCGDGGMPAASLPAIFNLIGKEDLVIPYVTNLKKIKTQHRYALSKSYTFLLNTIFNLNIKYFNGLPVYPTEMLRKITITNSGFGFQAEILITLIKSGCTYSEVGVKGAEETGNSSAVSLKNLYTIFITFIGLVFKIASSHTLPKEEMERIRANLKGKPQKND
jgi:glycosyltransferase involved in cell wall biosynthesis